MKRSVARTMLGALLLAVLTPATAFADPGGPPAADRVEARTGSSTAVVRTDGARTVTLYTGPVQVQLPGGWVPVDLTLRTDPDGVVRPVTGPHDLTLGPAGPSVRFTGSGSAALDWPGPLPAPRLEGNRATYPQARPGYDLVVEATRSGFVASVRTAGPATGPAPELVLRGSARRAEATPDAPRAATEAAPTAVTVSRVVAAAPVPAGTNPVPFDTTVQTTVRYTDTSGEPDLRLGSYDGVAVARSFLTWDLRPLAGRPVTSATLRVHQNWSSSCRPAAWQVWSAPAVGPATRWSTQPAAERLWAASTETRGNAAACAPGTTPVDVTELVRSWSAAGAPAGTLQLRAADETDPLSWKRLDSAEGLHVPELVITLG